MLTHFARGFPKSRAKCRINLRDKFASHLGIRIAARQCAQRSRNTKFYAKIRHQIAQNHEFCSYAKPWASLHFSNGFSGAPRVFHKLHMT